MSERESSRIICYDFWKLQYTILLFFSPLVCDQFSFASLSRLSQDVGHREIVWPLHVDVGDVRTARAERSKH